MSDGVTAQTGAAPTDIAVTDDERFTHVLNSMGNSISEFRVQGDGGLSRVGQVDGIPAGATGLVAR